MSMTKTEELNRAYTKASIDAWEKATGCTHYSRKNKWQKLKHRINRAYLALMNII